jgi:hypothetical protein
MATIKFFRSASAPANPQEGYIWFKTGDRTINLYKDNFWEVYTGLVNATYTNKKLEITKYDNTKLTIDLSDMASAATLSTLSNNFNTLQTDFNALSGEFTTEKGKISTLQGQMTSVQTETAKLSDVTGKVGAAIDAKVLVETNRAKGVENGLTNRVGALETDNTQNKADIATLKAAVGTGGAIEGAIEGAIGALNSEKTGNGTFVDVTVKQEGGVITSVTVAETDIASAKTLSDEITRSTEKDNDLEEAINTEKGRVDTLVGSDTGKSVRQIAALELAAQLIPENAKDAYDTLQEIAAWIQAHPEEAASMNEAIGKNTTAVSELSGKVANLEKINHDAYKAADTALEEKITAAYGAADATVLSSAKAYTDELKNGQVATNTANIATNTADIKTIKGDITTINTTIEENELVVASALTDLDTRVDALEAGSIKSIEGQTYIDVVVTDGNAIVSADLGTVAAGETGLALASDVKEYVDSTWE